MTDEMAHILRTVRNVRATGNDRWTGCCPGHEDKHASLSFGLSGDRLLLHCHAGCSFEHILASLGLGRRKVEGGMAGEPPEDDWQLDVAAIITRWMETTADEQYRELARSLGVNLASVTRLLPAWSEKNQAWAFPMQDGRGNYTGIRMRAMAGDKWAVGGSKSGLFIPGGLGGTGEVLIVEGPTDTAAALSLGYDAIGRPSCNDGNAQLIAWLKRHPGRDVVILANRDQAKQRSNGTVFYPGQEGAEICANAILPHCKSLKIIMPPRAKDARQWLIQGGTHGAVAAVISRTRPWYRKSPAKAG